MKQLEFGKAICYSGYRKGQSPKDRTPDKAQVAEDLEILARDGYRYIRMYDPNRHARYALEIIRERGLPIRCMVGIDSDPEVNNPNCPFEDQNYTDEELRAHIERNDRELDALIALANEFPDEIAAVSVGNENTPVWGAHLVSEDRLIAHARKLKANVRQPVTFCEGLLEWRSLSRLAAELDIISVHSYPYHMGTALADALGVNRQHYDEARALYPDKQVIFTEMGWSSDSETQIDAEGNAVKLKPQATPENQRAYDEAVAEWLERENIIGFIFEAFDELWKGDSPIASECNFGLYNESRRKKW